ncbi:hypothetical protein ACFWRG_09725 [Micromonospora tulbaghiae]|uniref:hypothetical protein n=1 Tax=Micromonospora tulbaghiae TaxID=479978 RepID=UPI0036488737
MDVGTAAVEAAVEVVEDARLAILLDEEVPALRGLLERLLARDVELVEALGAARALPLLDLFGVWVAGLRRIEAASR